MNTTLLYVGSGGILVGLFLFLRQDAVGYFIGTVIAVLGAIFLYFGFKGGD